MPFDELWKKDGPDVLADLPHKKSKKAQADAAPADFIYEQMDEACAGLPAVGKIWLRILQLKRMRPKEKYQLLGNAWLRQHGVTRNAKKRALRTLEKAGLIHVVRSDQRNPRVALIARSRRSLRKRYDDVAET